MYKRVAKIRHFWGILSALVKDSRQFKRRDKRLSKLVTVNLPIYKQLYNTIKKLYDLGVRRLSNVGEAVPPKQNGGKSAVRKLIVNLQISRLWVSRSIELIGFSTWSGRDPNLRPYPGAIRTE